MNAQEIKGDSAVLEGTPPSENLNSELNPALENVDVPNLNGQPEKASSLNPTDSETLSNTVEEKVKDVTANAEGDDTENPKPPLPPTPPPAPEEGRGPSANTAEAPKEEKAEEEVVEKVVLQQDLENLDVQRSGKRVGETIHISKSVIGPDNVILRHVAVKLHEGPANK